MRELSKISRQLNRNNKKALGKISNYIYANGVITKVCKEVRIDLASMLLESQNRGEDLETVIGSDYKAFCDELIENCPRKTSVDAIVENLFIIGISISIIIPMVYFWGILTPSLDQYVDGRIYYTSPRSFSIMLAGAFGGGIGSFVSQKYIFSKKKTLLYLILYLTVYIIITILILAYLRHKSIADNLIGIDMFKAEAVAILMSMIFFVFRTWRMKIHMNRFKKTK